MENITRGAGMAHKGKAASSKDAERTKKLQKGYTTDPFVKWDYKVMSTKLAIFKKLWQVYKDNYDGNAEFAILDRDWISSRSKKRTPPPNTPKYFVDSTSKICVAQQWYPNYKKAVAFTSTYESLRSCMFEASVNYTLYAILRVEHSEIKFCLHRRSEDIRMFQYGEYIWRLVGGKYEDIPYSQIDIDPDRICKYFQMRIYTSPSHL
jgi:hypothetical protein